jgi:glycosyltransferase involved in cell wall biosynthesis
VAASLQAEVLCFDCNDHVGVHAAGRSLALCRRLRDEIAAKADVVFAVSENLVAEMKGVAPTGRLWLLPNGVSDAWFARRPEDVPEIRRSKVRGRHVAGFVGSLYEWVDLDLIAKCAEELGDFDFVLVGPRRLGVSARRLAARANVLLVGPKPFDELPSWIAGFDVCLVPFKRGVVNDMADPLKLYEYCALGKPVVSTCLPGGPQRPPFCCFVDSAEQFVRAVRRSVAEDTNERAEARIDFARANTWRRRAEQLLMAVHECGAGPRRRSPAGDGRGADGG